VPEPCEGKLSCTVLRGEGGSNTADLPDQLIENKQKFIGQIMTSKSPVRSCDDIDEVALSYAEVKALATGNPYIREKMDLDIQVSKLKLLKANHISQRYRLEDNIVETYPKQIADIKSQIAGYQADIQTYIQNKIPDKDRFSMRIGDKVYTDKKEAGTVLIETCRIEKQPNGIVGIGEYQGFLMSCTYDTLFNKFILCLKGELSYKVELGPDATGNILRLNHALEMIPAKLAEMEQQLFHAERQLETAKSEVLKPFAQEQELSEKLERLNQLNALLNMDEKGDEAIEMDDEVEVNRLTEMGDTELSLTVPDNSDEYVTEMKSEGATGPQKNTYLGGRQKERISVKEKLMEVTAKINIEKTCKEKMQEKWEFRKDRGKEVIL